MYMLHLFFILTIIVYVAFYNNISDIEFAVIALCLLSYLYLLREKKEHFANDMQMMDNSYTMLLSLPSKVKEIILPQFDYVIQSVKGGSESDNNNMHTINETDFSKRTDPDLYSNNQLDQDKYNKLVIVYKNIDKLLTTLKTLDESKYNSLF
jgi:hypothetical protein